MQKTNFKYEILIHDDASTDGTVEIINEYQKKYPSIIKPIFQKTNQYSQGVNIPTINYFRATGKYLALCEGDDYWTDPLKLQKQVYLLENYQHCSWSFHPICIEKNGMVQDNIIDIVTHGRIFTPNEIFEICGGYFSHTSSIIFRKKYVDQLPSWFFDAPVGDISLKLFLSTMGSAAYVNDPMSVYRVNLKSSWTERTSRSIFSELSHKVRMVKLYKDFNQYTNYRHAKNVLVAQSFLIAKIVQHLQVFDRIRFLAKYKYNRRFLLLPITQSLKILALLFFPNIEKYIKMLKRIN